METSEKNSRVDLKLVYNNILNAGMTLSLMIIIIIFFSFQTFESGVTLPDNVKFTTKVIDIPQTDQLTRPLPPQKPTVPVAADDDEILDDVPLDQIIAKLDDVSDLLQPPPNDIEEVLDFTAVSQKPVLIHRIIPKYPIFAKKAGVQGMVVINVIIDEKGNVEKAEVFKSIPMLDDAALAAAKKCKFKPAKQMDKYVKVRMSIPFTFKLR